MPTSSTFRPRTAADHLPRSNEPGRNIGKGLLGVLAALVLVIGVPTALVLLVGNPLPTSAPSREWLTADVTAGTIIKVVAVLVWLVWAHFVVCLIAEGHAMRAGRMPAEVLFGGGPQAVARRLIATILLLTGVAAGAQSLGVGHSAGSASLDSSMTIAAASLQPGTQAAATSRGNSTSAQPLMEETATKYYAVQPPHGRHYDTLWDIAERHLGDPLRYKEIFALNKDKVQADGRRLVDSNLIYPGWELRMPGDATGAGIRSVAATQAPSTSPLLRPLVETGDGVRAGGAADSAAFTHGAALSAHQDADSTSWMHEFGGYLAGGLILAGLLVAVRSRRGPYGEPSDNEGKLRLAASPGRASFIDQALRELAAARLAAGQQMPQVSVAYASDDQLILHVVGTPEPPALPWRTGPDGTSWTLDHAELPTRVASSPAPYPALVAIARSHDFDLLVDLEFAPGIISIGGYDTYARESAMSCAADLCTHAWSDFVQVTLVGFADGLSDVVGDKMTELDDVDLALDRVEERLGHTRDLLHRLGVNGVLEGRSRTRHPDLAPQVLILSSAPTTEQARRIATLQAAGNTSLTVLVVGDAPTARWRFTIDQTGTIDLGVLGPTGQANRWSVAATQFIRQLAGDAMASAQARDREVAASAATTHSLTTAPAAAAAYVERSAGATDGAGRSPVLVRLLGAVEVLVDGTPKLGRSDLFSEVVVMAALHPDGLHEGVLSANLWPRGVDEEVVTETVRRAADWLGTNAGGSPLLSIADDGLWHLDGDVCIDFGALVGAAARSDELQLVRLLDRIDAPVFSGTPEGRYTWLAFHRAARDARALLTQFARHRAADLAAGGRRREAIACLRAGVTAVPESQLLWRELLKLLGDDPDGLRDGIARMYAALTGSTVEPETSSLVRHLAPDHEDALA